MQPTLRRIFLWSFIGLTVSLTLLFILVFAGSQRTILQSAERFRQVIAKEVAQRVTNYLNEAPNAVLYFEQDMQYGIVNPKDAKSIQTGLLSLLLANNHISEASFTYGDSTGFNSDGDIQLVPASRGQITINRILDKKSNTSHALFMSRRTWFNGKTFTSELEEIGDVNYAKTKTTKEIPATDPTDHLTFQTPASKDFKGSLLWSDLYWSQADKALPPAKRHVEVSVQKSINNSQGKFAGVLRVGLAKGELDSTMESFTNASHFIFLCDSKGRLITEVDKNQPVEEVDDDLRVSSKNSPPAVIEALAQPVLKTVDSENPVAATHFRSGGSIYLCTFLALSELKTKNWIIGIVAPRGYYLGNLLKIREEIIILSVSMMGIILIIFGLTLRGINRAHSLILRETTRMNEFEFSASNATSRLHDINEVLAGLERAKRAVRAMGKYVPIDLVRRLYCSDKEPELGGTTTELSLLFTDIKDFTKFSEETSADRLADVLGRYLEVMANIIEGEHGTIDKYIGDAVMTFWNAPEAIDNHATLACRTALKCLDALEKLYQSSYWEGIAPFETRFGLHRCTVSVGHFGSPSRFNYTAIGDGVNLASRLEGLNKYYGTTVIASETIYSETKELFEFRLLDCVSVKGKTHGITIYELLGEKFQYQKTAATQNYEEAFQLYHAGEFESALRIFEKNTNDHPSAILTLRCRDLIENPPQGKWNSIHVFDTK
ncbi:MAG: adenylate/guanylate cyclase domain-containing protein [Chthoniobacterales bacterium]